MYKASIQSDEVEQDGLLSFRCDWFLSPRRASVQIHLILSRAGLLTYGVSREHRSIHRLATRFFVARGHEGVSTGFDSPGFKNAKTRLTC